MNIPIRLPQLSHMMFGGAVGRGPLNLLAPNEAVQWGCCGNASLASQELEGDSHGAPDNHRVGWGVWSAVRRSIGWDQGVGSLA